MVRLTTSILPVLIIALVACAALLSACGGGSSTSSTETSAGDGGAAESKGAAESGGAAEFRVPGANKQESNRIIAGSKEASATEREAASVVLATSFQAREKRDWAGQCATLSKQMLKVVRNSAVLSAKQGCIEALSTAGSKATDQFLVDPMTAGIGALRLVGGGQAFAFFHGTDGRDYLIPMEDEGGEWKVASLTAEPIPGS